MAGLERGGFACRGLSRSFPSRAGAVLALADVSFDVGDGEFVCLVGPSGCGKTTVLRLIAGLIAPTSGTIDFGSPGDRGRIRSALAFQDHGLFPWMSVLDNVAFGLETRGVGKSERRARASRFIDQFGLGGFARCHPHELSMGMRQRVSLARAFLADPEILLMDEPFGSLDALTKHVLQEELLRHWKERGMPVVYVTHDIEEAILLADRILLMSGRPGRILEELVVPLARPRNLLEKDLPEVRSLEQHVWNALEGEVRRGLAQTT